METGGILLLFVEVFVVDLQVVEKINGIRIQV